MSNSETGIYYSGKSNEFTCVNGLMEYSTHVIIEGQQVAVIVANQFLLEPPDEEFFRQQARLFDFNEDAYITALHKVPIVSKERVEKIVAILSRLANIMAISGLEHVHHEEAVENLEKAKSDSEL